MLRIYSVVIEVARLLGPIVEQIDRRDCDLARQMRRALASVALNCAEGSGSQRRSQRARYFNALGSHRETCACLDVAAALGYVEPIDPALADKLDHISAVLWRVAH